MVLRSLVVVETSVRHEGQLAKSVGGEGAFAIGLASSLVSSLHITLQVQRPPMAKVPETEKGVWFKCDPRMVVVVFRSLIVDMSGVGDAASSCVPVVRFRDGHRASSLFPQGFARFCRI